MAWDARSGLKLFITLNIHLQLDCRNGLGCPFGIPVKMGVGGKRGKKAHGSKPSRRSVRAREQYGQTSELATHLRSFFQRDRVAQGFQAAHRRGAQSLFIQLLKEMRTQVLVLLLVTQEMIKGSAYPMLNAVR